MQQTNLITRGVRASLFCSAMALAAPALAADPSLDSAVSAARQWASMSDSRATDKMWGASSDIMKQRIDKQGWADYLSQLRTEVGRYAGREWVQVVRVTDPVDLPQGQYVNVIFTTQFLNMPATETVSMVANKNRWVPMGYVVRKIAANAQPAMQ